MENSIEKDEEILNNIKTYMQENIDKGCHKFVYNDLGYDEKCVDVINAIEHILSDYKRVLKENERISSENGIGKRQYEELVDDYEKLNLENIELKKENEELRAKWNKDTHILQNELDLTNADKINNYIPVQKVKEKIEELKEAYEDSKDENGESEYYYPDYTIRVLEELLEKRK